MYPYDDEKNLYDENNGGQSGDIADEDGSVPADETVASESPASAEDGSYRIVRPDAGRSYEEESRYGKPERDPGYRDANYTSQSDTGASANFYSPATQRKEKKPKKQRRGMPAAAIVALCLVCALVGGGVGGVIVNGTAGGSSDDTPPITQTTAPTANGSSVSNNTGETMTAGDIYYNLALKQVVGISSTITGTNVWGMQVQGSVSGTGFVISEDGYILTNYHVIEEAYSTGSAINVMFSSESGYDTTEYTAEVIGFDRNNDVAVIKIDATGLTAATLGSSDDLRVGDTVYAVGNPLGELTYSMTPGIVSATDRVITTDEGTANMFQISAAVNEGNSGGPVYNAYGQVVGIVTAKPNSTSSGGSTEGIGFAIPIDDAVRIANDVIDGNHSIDPNADPAYMGITAEDPITIAKQYYGWPDGAYVTSVVSGSPAETAGLREGDIITELGGYTVSSYSDLQQELTFHSAGETCDIVVYRSGEYLTLSITFGSRPTDTGSNSDSGSGSGRLDPSGMTPAA